MARLISPDTSASRIPASDIIHGQSAMSILHKHHNSKKMAPNTIKRVRNPLPKKYYYFFWLCEPVRAVANLAGISVGLTRRP
jgi:hypothetical protein